MVSSESKKLKDLKRTTNATKQKTKRKAKKPFPSSKRQKLKKEVERYIREGSKISWRDIDEKLFQGKYGSNYLYQVYNRDLNVNKSYDWSQDLCIEIMYLSLKNQYRNELGRVKWTAMMRDQNISELSITQLSNKLKSLKKSELFMDMYRKLSIDALEEIVERNRDRRSLPVPRMRKSKHREVVMVPELVEKTKNTRSEISDTTLPVTVSQQRVTRSQSRALKDLYCSEVVESPVNDSKQEKGPLEHSTEPDIIDPDILDFDEFPNRIEVEGDLELTSSLLNAIGNTDDYRIDPIDFQVMDEAGDLDMYVDSFLKLE